MTLTNTWLNITVGIMPAIMGIALLITGTLMWQRKRPFFIPARIISITTLLVFLPFIIAFISFALTLENRNVILTFTLVFGALIIYLFTLRTGDVMVFNITLPQLQQCLYATLKQHNIKYKEPKPRSSPATIFDSGRNPTLYITLPKLDGGIKISVRTALMSANIKFQNKEKWEDHGRFLTDFHNALSAKQALSLYGAFLYLLAAAMMFFIAIQILTTALSG